MKQAVKIKAIISIVALCLLVIPGIIGCGSGSGGTGGQGQPNTWQATLQGANPIYTDYIGTYQSSEGSLFMQVICCSSGSVYTYFRNYSNGYEEFGYGYMDAIGNISVEALGYRPGYQPSEVTITGQIIGTSISGTDSTGYNWSVDLVTPAAGVAGFAGDYKGQAYTESSPHDLTFGVGPDGSVIALSKNIGETEFCAAYGIVSSSGSLSGSGYAINQTAQTIESLSFAGSITGNGASGTYHSSPHQGITGTDVNSSACEHKLSR